MLSVGWWSKRDLASVHSVFRKCVESDGAVSTGLWVQWSFPSSDPRTCPFVPVWKLPWKLPKRARRTKVSRDIVMSISLFWKTKNSCESAQFGALNKSKLAGLVTPEVMLNCIREWQFFSSFCMLKTVFLILGENTLLIKGKSRHVSSSVHFSESG